MVRKPVSVRIYIYVLQAKVKFFSGKVIKNSFSADL